MALVDCIGCGKTISGRAATCPACGAIQRTPPPLPSTPSAALPTETTTREKVVIAIAMVIGAIIFLQPEKKTPATNDPPPKRGLDWDIDAETRFSEDEKRMFKSAAAKVLLDDPVCDYIDGGDRPKDPRSWNNPQRKPYYVTCTAKDGKEMFNVFFAPADVSSNAPLRGPVPFNESASRKLCEAAIMDKAEHPSTVSIHSIMGYGTKTAGNGTRAVRQDFTAKNTYGLELKYSAYCYVDPTGEMVDIEISEKK